MSKRMPGIIRVGETFDDFSFPYYFYVDIPLDYDHNTQIKTFCDSIGFSEREQLIYSDARFAEVTNKLIPGEEYAVKVFQLITRQKSTEECVKFLKNQNYTIFAGMQGLTFLVLNSFKTLPIGTGVMMPDERDKLGILDCVPMWSSMFRYLDGTFRLRLMDANAPLDAGECILCFSGPVSAVM